MRDAEDEADIEEDADAQKLALGVKLEVTVLDTVDVWLPEKDALGLMEVEVLGDSVPHEEGLPVRVTVAVSEVVMQELTLAETDAEADTLAQAVPLEEKDVDAVLDTEAVWQLVEDELLLTDRELLGVNEELTHALPVDDCD